MSPTLSQSGKQWAEGRKEGGSGTEGTRAVGALLSDEDLCPEAGVPESAEHVTAGRAGAEAAPGTGGLVFVGTSWGCSSGGQGRGSAEVRVRGLRLRLRDRVIFGLQLVPLKRHWHLLNVVSKIPKRT